MNNPRITLLGSHNQQLVDFLDGHPDRHERAAAVLFRKISRSVEGLEDSDRYISVEVIPFIDDWVTDSSEVHIDFIKKPLRELYRKCDEDDLVFGFIHNHPNGLMRFSEIDDKNEVSLLTGIVNRNGQGSSLVAMVRAEDQWIARVRHGADIDTPLDCRHITVLGSHIEIYGAKILDDEASEVLARQSAAFGKPFSSKLNSLRAVVVGAGGTGSPTISMLARSGIGEIIVIDFDDFEKSNLNRVRGAKASDVGENKAEIQKNFIDGLGVSCDVAAINARIDNSYEAVAALSTADIIFGCTDDWVGRDVLNKAVYYYGIPLIDMGLGGMIGDDGNGQPILKNHSGRVSCVMPEGSRCLFCQGVIRQEWIDFQLAESADPERAKRDAAEGYLQNGGEAAPGVGPFTGMTANFALATLFNLLKPYRKIEPSLVKDCIYIDFLSLRFKSKSGNENPDCDFCKNKSFLLKREKSYLLGRPILSVTEQEEE